MTELTGPRQPRRPTQGSTPIAIPRTRTPNRLTAPVPGDSLIQAAPPPVADSLHRVSRILLLRTIIVSIVLLISVWLLSLDETPARAAMWFQSALIAVTYATSVVFGIALRRGADSRRIARALIANDLLVTTLLVYSTGGALSPYVFLYAFTLVGAGALAYRRGAVLASIGALVLLTAVALLAWNGIDLVPVVAKLKPSEQSGAALLRTLALDFAAMIGVGGLAYFFGEQVERSVETLATTRRAAADLLSLHRDIVRSLSSGLITTGKDDTILTANQTAADILRVPVASLPGKPIDSAMPGLGELLGVTGEVRRADLEISDDLVVGVTVSPLRDDRDEKIGRVINFSDLTELRRLETHIRRAERLATVGQLAAGIAHEIRNPLASISGSVELLRTNDQASEDDRALMTIVHREIQRLNALIGDLLDYANPKPRQVVELDVANLIDEILQVVKGDRAFEAITVESTIERPLKIDGDPAKLRQVIWNLLRNASDAAASGGKHISIEAAFDGDLVTIAIVDDGPGIPADKIAHIFDPFFTTKAKGTGLGLATCHAIVAEHAGRIDVESEPGRTRFLVRLPK